MRVVLNEKSTKETTLYSLGLYLNTSVFLFSFYIKICFKEYRNTHDMYLYKNITIHKE